MLKMFIACEDKASFLRACRVRHQVEALCDNEIDVSPVFWNFALLRHEGLQEWAVMEAASAEMIIVSLNGGSELPDHVKSWAEKLPIRTDTGQTALVALIGSNGRVGPSWEEDVAYLQDIAEGRGMDFFCNQQGGWGIGGVAPRNRCADRVVWGAGM